MGEIMADKTIPQSDVNEIKTAQAATLSTPAADDNTKPAGDASPPLFDPSGAVSPSDPTPSVGPIPEPEVKRGRGRPRKDGADAKRSHKKKPTVSPEAENAVHVAHAQIVVSTLDLVRNAVSAGECPAAPELRDATVSAWAAYLEEQGMEIPAWLQVAIISTMYVAPAFATPTGKGRVSSLIAKAKAWWIARRG